MQKPAFGATLLGAVLGGIIALSLTVLPISEAAIPVIDSSNITQQYATYLQTLQTVVNTAQQITLQIQELKSLPNSLLGNYQSILQQEANRLKQSLANTSGALNPMKDLNSVWNSTFKPAGTITAANYTSATASAVNGSTITALDQANYDSFSVVKNAINNMNQTQSNLNQLMTLNASAEGQKQTGQINNMLLAEQAKLLQQQNIIRAADAAARISYYQRQNQREALAQADADQAADSIKKMNTNVPVYR